MTRGNYDPTVRFKFIAGCVLIAFCVGFLGILQVAWSDNMNQIREQQRLNSLTEQEKFDEQFTTIHTSDGKNVLIDKKNDRKYIIDDKGDIHRFGGNVDMDVQVKI